MVQHGSSNLTDMNSSLFSIGSILQYSCDPGYMLDGPSILTCTTLGHWSSEPPRCIRSDGKDSLSLFNLLCIGHNFICLSDLYGLEYSKVDKEKKIICCFLSARATVQFSLCFTGFCFSFPGQNVSFRISRRTEASRATPPHAEDFLTAPLSSISAMKVTF